uniref:Uncharacterized protein n=1 Tax=Rhizophora mucronata TaxID=61149 RepID=A0A2P2QR34_RHIMU
MTTLKQIIWINNNKLLVFKLSK